MSKTKDDYIEQISEIFYNAIKNENLSWQKPWSAKEIQENLSHNPVTKTQYKGMNSLVLDMIKEDKGYSSSSWLTYNQIKELGETIVKGEKSSPIGFYTKTKQEKTTNEKGEEEKELVELKKPIFKKYSVFNLEQTTGISQEKVNKLLEDKSYIKNENFIDISQAEDILKNSGITIENTEHSKRAYYNITQDKIILPQKEQFANEDAYYSVAFHELGHATGHSSRLNRDMANDFGSLEYAKEELRAEIYSFLQAKELGIAYNLENHQSYIKSWSSILENDKTEIIKAVKDSVRMMNFVKENWVNPVLEKSLTQEQNLTNQKTTELSNSTTSQNKENMNANYAKLPMHEIISKLGFDIKRQKSTQRHIVMSDGNDTIIISRGRGYEKEGQTLGEGNYIYFNTNNANDKGTIYTFAKNRNLNIHQLVSDANIKDYTHQIIISDSKYYDPQVPNKYKSLENYNKSSVKSLSSIRKINPKILENFDSIKVDNYRNVVFPSYTLEEVKIQDTIISSLTLSGMNKKLLEKPLTQDKQGNIYDKPLNSLEEGKSGLSILIANSIKGNKNAIENIVIGENSIDNLSYAELKKVDLNNTAFISFNGSMKSEAIKALEYVIQKELPNIKNITAIFDNDKQGSEYDKRLQAIIDNTQKNIPIKVDKSNSKDWNDQLMGYKNNLSRSLGVTKTNEKSILLER